jgi:ATP/maltotriose-dependent transcriptional regulator MalT
MLERGNLFLGPLDDERIWYRYHHLFADLLKLLLEQEQPGLAGELHRRASCWYEAQGMIPEAFQHALSAGDMGLAARLVSENVLVLVEHAELAPILLRMEAAQVRRGHRPSEDDHLAVVRGCVCLGAGLHGSNGASKYSPSHG